MGNSFNWARGRGNFFHLWAFQKANNCSPKMKIVIEYEADSVRGWKSEPMIYSGRYGLNDLNDKDLLKKLKKRYGKNVKTYFKWS